MNDIESMLNRFRTESALFEASANFAAFAETAAHSSYLKRFVGGWADLVFRGAKAHGIDAHPHRALHMPEARKLSDIIENVRLLATPTGGRTRQEMASDTGGRRYISTLRIPGAPGGNMGGVRQWSRDWLARGERLRSTGAGNKFFGCYAMPTAAMREAWQGQIGQCDDDGSRDGYDFSLQSFELVRWHDGRTLVIAKSGSVFTQWVAVLDEGEADLMALLPAEDIAFVHADRAAAAKAWGNPPAPVGWFAVKGQDRQSGALGVLEAFETRVKAADPEDAKELARLQRYEIHNREHVNIFSAVESK